MRLPGIPRAAAHECTSLQLHFLQPTNGDRQRADPLSSRITGRIGDHRRSANNPISPEPVTPLGLTIVSCSSTRITSICRTSAFTCRRRRPGILGDELIVGVLDALNSLVGLAARWPVPGLEHLLQATCLHKVQLRAGAQHLPQLRRGRRVDIGRDLSRTLLTAP